MGTRYKLYRVLTHSLVETAELTHLVLTVILSLSGTINPASATPRALRGNLIGRDPLSVC